MRTFGCCLLLSEAAAYMRAYVDGPPEAKPSVLDPECYSKSWPEVRNCVKWWTNDTFRIVEGNSIPDHNEHGKHGAVLGPYCPFGKGDPRGYCLPCEGSQCPFEGMICPAQELAVDLGLDGDVPVAIQVYHEFPLRPDPTRDELPNHLYHNAIEYQQVGVHLNGVHLKGPSEAEGYNVDTSVIPLLCGGHVTPPVGPGPQYHYHKASTCDHVQTIGAHGPLIGYANDGFGIYGFQDIDGTAPVVDECNGHFGPVSNDDLDTVVYHYHIHETTTLPSLTFEKQEPTFQPYIIGCQGPSRGKCNSTIAKAPATMTDLGHNWCGVGCGYDLCVQPGTTKPALESYLAEFGKSYDWLAQHSVNDFTVCPDCYREHVARGAAVGRDDARWQALTLERHTQRVCRICTEGLCAKCRFCNGNTSASCQSCVVGGCTAGCQDCWEGEHFVV